MKQPRFSIHDAFEEENDEAIRVYGSTVVSNVPRPSSSGTIASGGATAAATAATNSGTGYVSNNPTPNELTCDPRSVNARNARIIHDSVFDEFANCLFIIRAEIINSALMTPPLEIVIH